ncbi:elongin-A2 [Eulemur rufifrons]|uniref:elongin-A2 n=1 Tax=Eulemur rufifrons TaxID=859984 RepID=UPI0037440B2C
MSSADKSRGLKGNFRDRDPAAFLERFLQRPAEVAPGCGSTPEDRERGLLGEDRRAQTERPDRAPAAPRAELRPAQSRWGETAMATATGWTLQAVEKLQARLATQTDPQKLEKYLWKLCTLPVTADIVAQTGIRETVKSLRKHQHVGDFARDLATEWKKLVLEERNTRPEPQRGEDSPSRKRPRNALQEEEMDGGSRGPAASPERRRREKHRQVGELQRPHGRSPSRGRRDETQQGPGPAPCCSSGGESSASRHVRAPRASASAPRPTEARSGSTGEAPAPTVPAGEPARGRTEASRARPGLGQVGPLGAPRGKGAVSRGEAHKSSQQGKRPVGAKGGETGPAWVGGDPHEAPSKEEIRRPRPGEGAQDKPPSTGAGREGDGEHGRRQPPPATHSRLGKRQHAGLEKTAWDKHKPSLGLGKGAGAPSPEVKEVSNNLQTAGGKLKTPAWPTKSGGSLPGVEDADVGDAFEPPTPSFQQYLNYDQIPQKRKIVKTSSPALGETELANKDSRCTTKIWDSVQKFPKATENQSKWQATGADPAMLGAAPTDEWPESPDLPLPTLEDLYRALSAREGVPSQPEPGALSSAEEDAAAFAGRRANSKMQVYSGSRGARLPQTVTLQEQCVRVLRKYVDSIRQVGEVPYSVLEPVLEVCTPGQLYRLERYNHALVGETDELWKIHCHRDFKEEKPEERESWRELYLRLRDAREQRLRQVTLNIRSAQDSKSTGRQAKMIVFNAVTKRRHDVWRGQERFASGGAADPANAKAGAAPPPTGSSQAPLGSASSSSHPSPENPNPASGCVGGGRARLAPGVGTGKPAPKKKAPLMAKTVRDFQRRFSRR